METEGSVISMYLKMRAPCKCGHAIGKITRLCGQDLMHCEKCKRYQYNAPRSETGLPKRLSEGTFVAPAKDPAPSCYKDSFFSGAYTTEKQATEALDDLILPLGLFEVYSEVCGKYIAQRPGIEASTPRIDRVFMPTAALLDLGWSLPIGVECKRSGTKLGPAVAQAIDYTWAEFKVYGQTVYLQYIFLWPLPTQFGPIASVMDQNRIGSLNVDSYHKIKFAGSFGNILSIDGQGEISMCQPKNGRKMGSR